MIDLDFFKDYNDKYGHAIGDKVLKEVSSSIKASIRSIDIPCRFGGDEFTIILPETESFGSSQVAERIMEKLKKSSLFDGHQDKQIQVTISIGHATYPEDANNSKELFVRADEALYKAKNSGKSRIIAYNKIG